MDGRRQASLHLSISPKGKLLGSHTVGWKYPVHMDTSTLIGWIIGGMVHWKSSPRKVTHPSEDYSGLIGAV